MTLTVGDVIIDGSGDRWTVDEIDAYYWRDQVQHFGYWLTCNGFAKWFSRRALVQQFGGGQGRKRKHDD